jgi:type II secretory pathway predicted ATPase ExeA
MYESFYGFHSRPFSAVPDLSTYFTSKNEEQIRNTLTRVIKRAEGPSVILGGTGFGKTTLALHIATDIARDFQVVFLQGAQLCSRRALLQSILAKLQLPYRDMGEGELRLSLYEHLQPHPANPVPPLVLIVDEADTLPIKLLEEIRAISNIVISGDARARIILVGGMRLEHSLANPQLEALNQRLAVRCYLTPWTSEETAQEIRFQIKAAGGKPESICTTEALNAAYRATEGIPRLLHQVLDHALLLGCNYGQKPLSASLIEEAWADLQQLPCPYIDRRETLAVETPSAIIEFGELSTTTGPDGDEEFSASFSADRASQVQPSLNIQPAISATSGSVVGRPSAYSNSNSPPSSKTTVRPWRDVFGNDFEEEILVDQGIISSPSNTKNNPTIATPEYIDLTNSESQVVDIFSNWLEVADSFELEPSIPVRANHPTNHFPASELEVELHNSIGDLNYSAITADFSMPAIHRLNTVAESSNYIERASSNEDEANDTSDDRDILIIEEDVANNHSSKEESPAKTSAQSPSRLFSQLKG